jgi:hypothetical protein
MDDFKSEKWTLEDGRRAERRVTENVNPNGEAERVVELHVEDERPLRLSQRVVEKRKPFVYEREIHTIDKTGAVVEKKVESIEPKVQMQLVEHLVAEPSVRSLSTDQQTDDNPCHVTREEMIEAIVAAMKAVKDDVRPAPQPAPAPVQPVQPVQPTPVPGSLADEIGRRVGGNTQPNPTMNLILWGVIAALVVGLGYVIFGM